MADIPNTSEQHGTFFGWVHQFMRWHFRDKLDDIQEKFADIESPVGAVTLYHEGGDIVFKDQEDRIVWSITQEQAEEGIPLEVPLLAIQEFRNKNGS